MCQEPCSSDSDCGCSNHYCNVDTCAKVGDILGPVHDTQCIGTVSYRLCMLKASEFCLSSAVDERRHNTAWPCRDSLALSEPHCNTHMCLETKTRHRQMPSKVSLKANVIVCTPPQHRALSSSTSDILGRRLQCACKVTSWATDWKSPTCKSRRP